MKKLRVGPVVALSLSAGFAAAAGLVLGPFGGAQEHVITGVTLIAFASGWAMLAGLSILRTDQPQRWVVAPAVLLGLTGAGLLFAAPGGHSLDALGWVWPPALMILALSMAAGARRQLRSRARRHLSRGFRGPAAGGPGDEARLFLFRSQLPQSPR